jgi:ubiquinone/menaquinone biosynthesis C-methylase UbiE
MPNVLDFGCGNGLRDEIGESRASHIHWLEENGGPGAIGIDVSPESIKEIQRKIQNGTLFFVMDGRHTMFRDKSFPTIHEHGVFHHMKRYPEAIKEIARIMVPGGTFWVKETVSNDRIYHLARVLTKSWRNDNIYSFFTTQELEKELLPYFEIEREEYYWRFAPCDMLLELGIDGPASLAFNLLVNQIWTSLGIERAMCCHCVIKARRKIE